VCGRGWPGWWRCPLKPHDRPGLIDVLVIILSSVIVAVLTAVFLLGFWGEAAWRWVTSREAT